MAHLRGCPFGEVVSFGSIEPMSLPSVALNMYDHSASFEAVSDLVSLQLSELCGMENLMVVAFQEGNFSGSVEYG